MHFSRNYTLSECSVPGNGLKTFKMCTLTMARWKPKHLCIYLNEYYYILAAVSNIIFYFCQ